MYFVMKRLLAVSLLAMIGLTACENDSVTSPLAPGSQATSFAKPAVPEFEPPEECPAASCLLGPETITRETKGPIVWVGEFAEVMHPEMVGLTGSPKQVKTASQAYRTYYRKQESDDPDYYLVDHSTFSYLVMPEDGFVDFFRRELTPEQMADRVGCFLDAAS
mgnify:CR=1 FL=1